MNLVAELKKLGIQNLSLNSRDIGLNGAFLAYVGFNNDARNYFEEALQIGAKAIIYEADNIRPTQQAWLKAHEGIKQYPVPKLLAMLPRLANEFYGNPSSHQHIIGVTGTNGKSSIVHGLTQLYTLLDEPSAMIGTLGIGRLDDLGENLFTTPDAVTVQRTLRELLDDGIETINMEVSSHALMQDRVSEVKIDTAIYTNLTRDHLDYHKTMQAYGEAKCRLYRYESVKNVIVNLDDPWFYEQLNHIPVDKLVVGYTLQNKSHPRVARLLSANDIKTQDYQTSFVLQTEDSEYLVKTPLLGKFNVSNALAMLAALHVDGFPLEDIIPLIMKLNIIPGRLQRVNSESQPLVVVDFAHSPDALKNVLTTLQPHCQGEMICVFGCGGERDRGKRQLMGEIAQQYCNKIVITDDNPRNEDPMQIVRDILQGIQQHSDVRVIHDRKLAIHHAISMAKQGDCVLIAGKGHETTQTSGGIKQAFNDVNVAKDYLARMQ